MCAQDRARTYEPDHQVIGIEASLLLALFSGDPSTSSLWREGLTEHGRSAWSVDRPTTTDGRDRRSHPGRRSGRVSEWCPAVQADTQADGHRHARLSGQTRVVRHSYDPANPHRWTTAGDQRNASGRAVGRGGRPPWCPLAPSSRPSQSVHRGRRSGRVSRWVSGRRLESVHPTAGRAGKVQESGMSGRLRSARRRLAPTTRAWLPGATASAACCGSLGT
jgi:hypothetical protein